MDFEVLGEYIGFLGMNFDILPEKLPPTHIMDGDNILCKNGKIKKMKGVDFFNDVATKLGITNYREILGIPIYRQWDADKFQMAVTPRRVYYMKNDNEWFNIGSIAAGENASILSYANADNKIILVLSDDGVVYYWDGATWGAYTLTLSGVTTLKSRFLLEFKTHLFLFRTIEDGTEYYAKFRWSNPGVLGTFQPTDAQTIDTEGKIMGAKQLEDVIIAYLDESIHQIWFIDPTRGYGVKPIVTGEGLLAPRTLCGGKHVHYFLCQEGLMKLLRGDIPRSISDKIFNKLVLDQLDPIYYNKAVQHFYPHLNLLYFSYPKSGSTYNNVQVIFDASINEVVSKKDLVGDYYSAYGTFEKDLSGLSADERKSYGLSYLPLFGTKTGYVKEQKVNSYQDGIRNNSTEIVFPPRFFKDRNRFKRVLQVDLIYEKYTDQDITLGIDIANEMNQNFGYNYTLTGSGNQGIRRVELQSDDNDLNVDVSGKAITIRVKDQDNPYGWDLHGMIVKGWHTTVK